MEANTTITTTVALVLGGATPSIAAPMPTNPGIMKAVPDNSITEVRWRDRGCVPRAVLG
jgi:hypothetical protein